MDTFKNVLLYLGNLGNLLAGITLFVIYFQYNKYKKEQETSAYWEKIKRTFEYINTLKDFYNKFKFLFLSKYLTSIKNRESLENLTFYVPDKKLEAKGAVAAEEVKRSMIEIYTFFKEISYVLKKNKEYKLVDEKLLYEYFKSYSHQIKEFFVVASIILETTGEELKNQNIIGWGYLDKSDLREVRMEMEKSFDFLR